MYFCVAVSDLLRVICSTNQKCYCRAKLQPKRRTTGPSWPAPNWKTVPPRCKYFCQTRGGTVEHTGLTNQPSWNSRGIEFGTASHHQTTRNFFLTHLFPIKNIWIHLDLFGFMFSCGSTMFNLFFLSALFADHSCRAAARRCRSVRRGYLRSNTTYGSDRCKRVVLNVELIHVEFLSLAFSFFFGNCC